MNRRPERSSLRPAVNVLGVPICPWQVDDLIDFALQRTGEPASPSLIILYANVHVLNTAFEDPDLQRSLVEASTVYCDGSGVRLGAWILGHELPVRITGADWIDLLCSRAAAEGHSLFLLGGQSGVAARAAEILTERHPGLRVAGTHHGFANDADRHTIDSVNQSDASILLVGMGSPRQERWIRSHRELLRPPVVWVVGALFDFVAGVERRGPQWMVDHHLEWAARLFAKPTTHWRRYLFGNPLFIVRVARQRFFGLRNQGGSEARR